MHIPFEYEHLFYKYFVRRSGYKRQKSLATYGCCHPCSLIDISTILMRLINNFYLTISAFCCHLIQFAFSALRLSNLASISWDTTNSCLSTYFKYGLNGWVVRRKVGVSYGSCLPTAATNIWWFNLYLTFRKLYKSRTPTTFIHNFKLGFRNVTHVDKLTIKYQEL